MQAWHERQENHHQWMLSFQHENGGLKDPHDEFMHEHSSDDSNWSFEMSDVFGFAVIDQLQQ